MFPISILLWKSVDKYDAREAPKSVLLKCHVNGVYSGWYDSRDGWHRDDEEDRHGPVEPQPKWFARIPM